MKSKLFLITMLFAFMISCSSSKQPQANYPADPIYDRLEIGMSKQDVIAILGKNYKYDMNNVTQTATNYVETLIWNSSNPDVAYALTFTNDKLSRKNRERVVQTPGGGNIQINR